MVEICGTFDGYEGEKGHRWGKSQNEKLFFRRRCLTTDEVQMKRLLDEIRLVNGLNHPNINTPVGLFTAANQPDAFVYSRVAEFGSVNRVLSTFYNYGLPEAIIQNILRQILPAISFVHEQGIVHRGISAQNILLRIDGTALLCGLEHAIKLDKCNRWIGVYDRIHDFDDSLQTVLAWLAPEVLKQDIHGYGQNSDVYSVGITICEMGNGFPPFNEMEPLQVMFEKNRGSTPYLVDSTREVMLQIDSAENNDAVANTYKKQKFSDDIHDFVAQCLTYISEERPTSFVLLRHKFIESEPNANLKSALSKLLLSKIIPLSMIE